MRLTVLYFAAVRDLAAVDSEEIELPDGVDTVAGFTTHLRQVRPELDNALGAVRVAVNEQFADAEQGLSQGDVVALIPPTAGG